MADGTKADYQLIEDISRKFNSGLPQRIRNALIELEDSYGGWQVSRLEHSLQTATRAYQDHKDEEYIVMALVHDIGDNLAPLTHSEMAAAIVRPFVRPELYWIARHHGIFQMYYYGKHTGHDPDARDIYRDSEWFGSCAEFCEKYDQESFDPNYESLPLEFFDPMLAKVFTNPQYL
jgi:predicted HD phosphohydrolase